MNHPKKRSKFEVQHSVSGFCNFWTGDYEDSDEDSLEEGDRPKKGLLSHWIFDDYRRLERIYNSENWSDTYGDRADLTEDLKWLHKKVVFGVVNHPDINFDDITESKFIFQMRKWLKVVSALKSHPLLKKRKT